MWRLGDSGSSSSRGSGSGCGFGSLSVTLATVSWIRLRLPLRMARCGLLLLVALSMYTTLLVVTSRSSTEGRGPVPEPREPKTSHMRNIQSRAAAAAAPPSKQCGGGGGGVDVGAAVGQCEYNLTLLYPIPRVGAVTGTTNTSLFVYDTTLEFEHGGTGRGMAYFVGFLEAHTPKYMDGGNHGAGAGLSLASSLFTSSFRCHWSIPRGHAHGDGSHQQGLGMGLAPQSRRNHAYTQVAWYLNGDTSTFSFYCRIPASIGAYLRCASNDIRSVGLRLENAAFISHDHAVEIPMCRRDSQFHHISICTQPLHAPLMPHQLKQWMEYHYMVGVDNFYIYDRDNSFANMLAPYERAGLATRYVFPLLTKGMDARWYDQPQAMHVCLHRHRHASRWIFFLDVDEYLHSDLWTHKAPHVKHLLDRYEEAPLHPYTHLIVWKRIAVPQQRDAPWDPNNTLELEHFTKYGKPQRVAVKFALRPWDGRALSVHHPNGFVKWNSKAIDLPPQDLVISHMKAHNTLAPQQIDTSAKPPHSWCVGELRARMWDPTYQVTQATVTSTNGSNSELDNDLDSSFEIPSSSR